MRIVLEHIILQLVSKMPVLCLHYVLDTLPNIVLRHPGVFVSDLLQASDLEFLMRLEHADEICRVEYTVVRAGVELGFIVFNYFFLLPYTLEKKQLSAGISNLPN